MICPKCNDQTEELRSRPEGGAACPSCISYENDAYYMIVRFYSDGRSREIIADGLTREEARAHCQNPDTSGELADGVKWFDGFEEE